ncbi:conserved hypothetical protein [Ixodes scapularis]|uniref:Uncharacterized protein n=1 Tax=Ixodes scapularis TaxID=6945 RepID=B7PJK4_IXOSC|nr:conserved hypothetical protein [Ixodes scapularis]|eukprot:XP_002408247.1 conserved hypothetical protein [Ixodes scapularis]
MLPPTVSRFKVEARDREIERLSRLLRDGIPYKALSENGRCSCKLQEEPAPDPKVTLPADQAPCPELRKSVAALKPVKHVRKVNFGHLQRKAEPLGKDLKQTKNKRLASSGGEDASCAENAKFREVLEALRLEKRTLQERVQQMASNERELLREMERLCKEQHRDPAPKDPECDGLQALVRSLERERDHYKEELVQLHQTLESGNLRPKNAAPTSTRGISESQQTLPKNMAADLDNAVQQREEFKIQIQEYVTEVARVQELLQLKVGQRRLRAQTEQSQAKHSNGRAELRRLQEQTAQMSGHLRRLEDDLSLARNEAATARSDASGLESLLSESRERHCHADLSLRQLSVELDAVKEQLRLGAVNREKCQEDFRRWKEQQQGGLRGRLTLHGFAGTLQTKLNFSPENGAQPQ